MLILARNVGETIILGDNEVRIMVTGVDGKQVKLGIKADKDIPILREEIYLKQQGKKNHE